MSGVWTPDLWLARQATYAVLYIRTYVILGLFAGLYLIIWTSADVYHSQLGVLITQKVSNRLLWNFGYTLVPYITILGAIFMTSCLSCFQMADNKPTWKTNIHLWYNIHRFNKYITYWNHFAIIECYDKELYAEPIWWKYAIMDLNDSPIN